MMVSNYLHALAACLVVVALVNVGASVGAPPLARLGHFVAVGACGLGVAACAALGAST